MKRMEFSRVPQRLFNTVEDEYCSELASISNNSLVAYGILSVFPISMHSRNELCAYAKKSKPKKISSDESISNKLLCKINKTNDSFNTYSECLQCNPDQIRSNFSKKTSIQDGSNKKIFTFKAIIGRQTVTKDEKLQKNKTSTETYISSSHYENNEGSRDDLGTSILSQNEHFESNTKFHLKSSGSASQTSLCQHRIQSTMFTEETRSEVTNYSSITDDPVPCTLQLSIEDINYYKQIQTKLNHVFHELTENFENNTKINLNVIVKIWSHLKQSFLNQIQPKIHHRQLFDSLVKSFSLNKQYECYIDNNDEIQATLRVLSTTLFIVHDKYSFAEISLLFDDEEKVIIQYLANRLEWLLSSYRDEFSLMQECSQYYQRGIDKLETLNWIQIIQNEYPVLITRVIKDINSQVPQIQQIILIMLQDMKKRLLNIYTDMNPIMQL